MTGQRRRDTCCLTEQGYKKIWKVILEEFEQKPTLQELSAFIGADSNEQHGGRPLSADTISKIINRKRKTDRTSIVTLFQPFGLTLSDDDITYDDPPILSNSDYSNRITLRSELSGCRMQNLPPQHNQFVGREEQLCELMKYLSPNYPAPIIEVNGIAGVGKTALVLEAAYLCLEYRERGKTAYHPLSQRLQCEIPRFEAIIFTSAKQEFLLDTIQDRLSPQRNLQAIYRKIVTTLEEPAILHDSDNRRHIEKIYNKFREVGRTLLIVDNLETIQDRKRVLSFIYELPNAKTIYTTREKASDMFQPISLKSLSREDSLKLINQQLELRKKGLNHQQKEKLYEVTSGIPLAIIYSIGRFSSYCSIETILKQLKDANNHLSHFCFSKSIDDIKEIDRVQNLDAYKLFMSISIFYKSPSFNALIKVTGLTEKPRPQIEKSIESLINFSLIYDLEGRFFMLPLTREYAYAELEKNIYFKKQLICRWMRFYLNFAARIDSCKSKDERFSHGYRQLAEEWDNLLHVLRFCKEDKTQDTDRYEYIKELWFYLENYANLRGHWKDRVYWLKWIINKSRERGEHPVKIRAMTHLARTLLLMGGDNFIEAETILLDAWEQRHYADYATLDYLTNHLAGLYTRLERYQEAHRWLDEEQKLFDQHKAKLSKYDDYCMYKIYIDRERAEVYFCQQNHDKAKQMCDSVITLSKAIKHRRNENYANKILADIYIRENHLEEAECLLKTGFEEVKAHDDKRRIAYYETSFALLEKAKGDFKKAESYIVKAMTNFDYLGMIFDFEKAKLINHDIQEKLKQRNS
ncbi:ATP-binding protein [Roseofilum reptotaenium CS-1145]|uniref:Orc1-like AAA ATPase domain-containing protein n=1 Tax=Roseofilum reptotaenium AO1-A TaxID=1925591 RepID=A0A1L9QN53_9CYAN|nr:ATP-binding protein [Roseofilum reptotaenium]MDB9515736.1 ATP-binding protein [Roseofilum reptotaenium CS-1145]OJJ24079.1 hypothetical protein BI308_18555 [Roseofilum reptotaenium AO1-A]